MMKKRKKILSIISSVFGVAALCGLFSLVTFSNDSCVDGIVQTNASTESYMATTTFMDKHYTVTYNKFVNDGFQATRNVDYNVSWRVMLVRVNDLGSVNYYLRMEFSYFWLKQQMYFNDSVQDTSLRLSFSNQSNSQDWMSYAGGFVITTSYLSDNCSYNFSLALVKAQLTSSGIAVGETHAYHIFRLFDTVTGEMYGSSGSSFDWADNYCTFIPRDAWQAVNQTPSDFQYNLERTNIDYAHIGNFTIFENFSFDVNSSVEDVAFNNGYNVGYKDGYNYGWSTGLVAGREAYQSTMEMQLEQARQEGYNSGLADGFAEGLASDSVVTNIFSGILQVGMLPINMFLAMFNFEILGINMSSFISALLTVCITIIVIKFVIGNSGGGDS